jgi:hypothetical protein
MFYVCYIDILIIYDSKQIHPNLITASMNQTHKDIKFNPTHEDNGQINFLDPLPILNHIRSKLTYSEKPPTRTTINFFPNHPTEHKIGTFRYYIK